MYYSYNQLLYVLLLLLVVVVVVVVTVLVTVAVVTVVVIVVVVTSRNSSCSTVTVVVVVVVQYRAEVTYQDPRVEGRGWRVTRGSTFVNDIVKKYWAAAGHPRVEVGSKNVQICFHFCHNLLLFVGMDHPRKYWSV